MTNPAAPAANYAVVMDGYTWATAPSGYSLRQLMPRERATAYADDMNTTAERMGRAGRWHAEFVW